MAPSCHVYYITCDPTALEGIFAVCVRSGAVRSNLIRRAVYAAELFPVMASAVTRTA
jgi:hypothetical protein